MHAIQRCHTVIKGEIPDRIPAYTPTMPVMWPPASLAAPPIPVDRNSGTLNGIYYFGSGPRFRAIKVHP